MPDVRESPWTARCMAVVQEGCFSSRFCGQLLVWIECPTGGWWKHLDHPADYALATEVKAAPSVRALCGQRWEGHTCIRPADATTDDSPPGDHEHHCNCTVEWVSHHPYHRCKFSGAGNCWCGRDEGQAIHGRTWRFWCDQCGEIGQCTFTSLEDETTAALNLIEKHQGHGLGGFMTPVKP